MTIQRYSVEHTITTTITFMEVTNSVKVNMSQNHFTRTKVLSFTLYTTFVDQQKRCENPALLSKAEYKNKHVHESHKLSKGD